MASLLCGLSQSAAQLTAARVLQGIGGAMMVPVGRLVMLRSIEKSELVAAMAYLTLPGQIGPVLGPVIGGFITYYFHWRWIFLINLPIGLLGIVLAMTFISDDGKIERRPLDWAGFLLSGVALSSLMCALESIGHGGADPIVTTAMFAAGLVAGLLAVLHARRYPQPLLDLPLLRIQTFRLANAGSILFRTGAGALPFLLPLLFQGVLGMTAFHSGLLIAANPIGSLPMKILCRPVLKRLRLSHRADRQRRGDRLAFVALCGWFGASTPPRRPGRRRAADRRRLPLAAIHRAADAHLCRRPAAEHELRHQHCQHGAAARQRVRRRHRRPAVAGRDHAVGRRRDLSANALLIACSGVGLIGLLACGAAVPAPAARRRAPR